MEWTERWWYDLTFFLSKIALSIGISRITRKTWTRRKMIDDLTNGVLATCSWTRVFALISNTCETWWAIRVQNTFRSTAFVRVSNVISDTCTSTSSILFSTNSIRSTRTWRTWGRNFNRIVLSNNWTLTKRITSVSSKTITHWRVTDYLALSIETTSIWTWIFTFLVDAS